MTLRKNIGCYMLFKRYNYYIFVLCWPQLPIAHLVNFVSELCCHEKPLSWISTFCSLKALLMKRKKQPSKGKALTKWKIWKHINHLVWSKIQKRSSAQPMTKHWLTISVNLVSHETQMPKWIWTLWILFLKMVLISTVLTNMGRLYCMRYACLS